jgi:hypothetical protein
VSETGEIEMVEMAQEVDAVAVLAPESRGGGLIRAGAPATQAMAVAAGGFVAGVAVVGLAARRRGRRARALSRGGRGARKGSRAGELVQIVGTRSLLVDVHLLDGAKR